MSRVFWTSILAVTALSMSGCITGIFLDTTTTTREFTCAALSPDTGDRLILDVRVDEETNQSPVDAVARLRAVIASIAGRAPDSIEVRIAALEPVTGEWDDDAWSSELKRFSVTAGRRTIHMAVYWVSDLQDHALGQVLQPGAIAIGETGLLAKAAATGLTMDQVAIAAVLHFAGHAFGAVNQGIPMQANHEGQPGHDANASAVMHHSWHDANDAHVDANATLNNYASQQRRDWRLAVENSQVCP